MPKNIDPSERAISGFDEDELKKLFPEADWSAVRAENPCNTPKDPGPARGSNEGDNVMPLVLCSMHGESPDVCNCGADVDIIRDRPSKLRLDENAVGHWRNKYDLLEKDRDAARNELAQTKELIGVLEREAQGLREELNDVLVGKYLLDTDGRVVVSPETTNQIASLITDLANESRINRELTDNVAAVQAQCTKLENARRDLSAELKTVRDAHAWANRELMWTQAACERERERGDGYQEVNLLAARRAFDVLEDLATAWEWIAYAKETITHTNNVAWILAEDLAARRGT